MSVNNNGVLSGTITNIDSANLAETNFATTISSIVNGGYITLNDSSIKPSNKLEINGEGADILVNDKSLMATLERIEQRLNIFSPNKELEEQWEELRELGEKYRELEKQLENYNKVWQILSKD